MYLKRTLMYLGYNLLSLITKIIILISKILCPFLAICHIAGIYNYYSFHNQNLSREIIGLIVCIFAPFVLEWSLDRFMAFLYGRLD